MIDQAVIESVKRQWNRGSWIGRKEVSAPASINRDALVHAARRHSMHYPYVTLVRDGVQPPLREFSLPIAGRPE